MNKTKTKKQYSLFTAISMIIGIVIGSGIFFKSDDVLKYTNGNVWLGVLVFVIAAISIIFGSLAIAQLALRTDKAGGVITYMEETWSKSISGSFGWFHALVYYPTLIVVVAWVAGIYIAMLFGFKDTLETQVLIGLISIIVLFLVNIYAKKIGDYLQISSTILKLIPLFLIAIAGLFLGEPSNITANSIVENGHKLSFMSAIVPIAFSFDGWIISTSISHEIKNSKKSLPIALIVSPIFIVLIYSLYLLGISALVGPAEVINLGNAHVDVAANMILGASGAKVLLTFVVISVLGTVNGLIMGAMRLPYSLSVRKIFPKADQISKINTKLDVPVNSSIIAFFISMVWLVVHYFVMKFDLLIGSDVSEISIVINYVCYIALYAGVIKLYKKGEIKKSVQGIFIPIMATIGSLIILAGSIINTSGTGGLLNTKAISFMAISVIVLVISYFYCNKKLQNNS